MADSPRTRAAPSWLSNLWRGDHEDHPSPDALSPHHRSAQQAQPHPRSEFQPTQVGNDAWWSPGRTDGTDERTPLLRQGDDDIQRKTREYHSLTRRNEIGTLLGYAGPAFLQVAAAPLKKPIANSCGQQVELPRILTNYGAYTINWSHINDCIGSSDSGEHDSECIRPHRRTGVRFGVGHNAPAGLDIK